MNHDKTVKSERGLEILTNIRSACARLPEVSEKVDSFGHTSFRVTDKPFVMMGESDEGTSLSIKTAPATQDFLLQQHRYFKTPYIGQHGWVSLRATEPLDWSEIEELIVEAYLRTAPKRLTKSLVKE